MNVKRKLKAESQIFVPNKKDEIFAAVGIFPKPKPTREFRRLSLKVALSFCLLFVAVISVFMFQQTNLPPSNTIILVDINPSIEFEVDNDDKVIAFRPLNLDAALILIDNDNSIIGKKYDYAIIYFIELAAFLDYIDEDRQIIINVIDNKQKREDKLKNNLNEIIKIRVQEKGIKSEVIIKLPSQATKEEAIRNKVSYGRMLIIEEALSTNPNLTIQEAINHNIRDLNNIVRKTPVDIIENFKDEYRQKTNNLSNAYILAIQETNFEKFNLLNRVSEIRGMSNNLNNAKAELNNLIDEYFTDLKNVRINSVVDLQSTLNIIERRINNESAFAINQIIEKYQMQINMFKDNIRDTKNLNFNFDYEFKKPLTQVLLLNEHEQRAFILIQQMTTIIRIANNNGQNHGRVTLRLQPLYNEFNDIINSNNIRDEFINSKQVTDFLELYNDFKK